MQLQVPEPIDQRPWWISAVFRASWWLITGLVILFFIVSAPIFHQLLTQPCSQSSCLAMQIDLGQVMTLRDRGISLEFYAGLMTLILILLFLTNLAIGVFLYLHKQGHWLVILTSLMLITSIQADLYRAFLTEYPELENLVSLAGLLNFTLLIIFFYVFPSGSFQPRWTGALALFWVAVLIGFTYWLDQGMFTQEITSPLVIFILSGLIVSSLLVMILRYRYVFGVDQKRRARWVVYGVTVTLLGELLLQVLKAILTIIDQNAFLFIGWNILTLLWSIILPISILFAVLSNALMDIDVLIRRTLAYSILTLTLFLVYILSVLGLQRIFELAIGQSSALVSMISTLIIAALFTPFRRRIHDSINRLFYRQQYNTEIAFQQFTTSVREDVDLEKINSLLVDTLQRTLRPEFLSLWICRVNPDLDLSSQDQIR